MRISILSAAALLALAACSDSTGSGRAGPPARLDIVSGDLQTAAVGTELAQPLVVKVLDDKGKEVEGQIVNFRVLAGGGTVFAGAALTNADGEARERWTLGTVADSQRVEARAVDPATGASVVFAVFRAVATAGAPAALTVERDSVYGFAGELLSADSVLVRVRDRFGNPVPNAAVTFTAAQGSVGAQPVTTNAQGLAKAAWTLGATPGRQTLSATAGSAVAVTLRAFARLPFTRVSAGENTTCGIVSTGAAYCWGYGAAGSLGNGTSVTFSDPVRVSAAVSFAKIEVGPHDGVCAVTTTGAGYCWGPAVYGQPATAEAVPGGHQWATLRPAYGDVCGLTTGGDTYCWRVNSGGPESPALVSGAPKFTSLAVGDFSYCGLLASGDTYCWGANRFERGDSVNTPANALMGGVKFSTIRLAPDHGCALSASAGIAYCWGWRHTGELGPVPGVFQWTPLALPGGTSYAGLDTSGGHTCAWTAAGAVDCWGSNEFGQLGIATPAGTNTPTRVFTSVPASTAATGAYHTCVLGRDRWVYCSGRNHYAQLGTGDRIDRSAPAPLRVASW